MEKDGIFGRNLIALSKFNPALCALLSNVRITGGRYKFIDSRTGDLIPALVDPSGTARPLHSTVDPRKEARRLIDSQEDENFLILLGLGAAYYAEAALERNNISMALVIEFDLEGLAELLCRLDYTCLFSDPRFRLLVDPSGAELKQQILDLYRPVLCGGIRVIPLRSRTSFDTQLLNQAAGIISSAIEKISADYSVQAHFGKRWFSNIIRNLKNIEETRQALPPVERAAVTAAGPSLSMQIERLREKREGLFLIAADTSLPCLLNAGIIPDAVISIDCQHIGYYHFMDGLPEGVKLFLDLASPPLLASMAKQRYFFSCGHPLTRYISGTWRALPELDSSGGNVTYAAVSLADQMGAAEIELYGADYSYPCGISYARGTYIYSFFTKRQSRLSPLEAQASAFLFRTPLEKKLKDGAWYYETKTLNFYREKLEEKSESLKAALIPIEGMGASINLRQDRRRKTGTQNASPPKAAGNTEKAPLKPEEFLSGYRNDIKNLPDPGKNSSRDLSLLGGENLDVFISLLPTAAALKHRHHGADFRELLEETKKFCLREIDTVLTQ